MPLILDTDQADAERTVVGDRRQDAGSAVSQGKHRLAVADVAVHARIVLKAGEIAELVDRLPEIDRLRLVEVDALLPPFRQVRRIKFDPETRLAAEGPGDFGEGRILEIELEPGRLRQEGVFNLLSQSARPWSGPPGRATRERCARPREPGRPIRSSAAAAASRSA